MHVVHPVVHRISELRRAMFVCLLLQLQLFISLLAKLEGPEDYNPKWSDVLFNQLHESFIGISPNSRL